MVVTRNMQVAARQGVAASGGTCVVTLEDHRDFAVGRHAFKCRSQRTANQEGLKYARAKLREQDRW